MCREKLRKKNTKHVNNAGKLRLWRCRFVLLIVFAESDRKLSSLHFKILTLWLAVINIETFFEMTNILGLWVSALLSIIWGIFCLILQIRLCKIVGCLKADKWTKTLFSCKWQKTIKIISPSSNGSKQWLWTCWCLKNCLRWFCLLFRIVFYSRVACRVSNFQPKRWLDHFKFQGDSISSTNYRVSYMTNILNFCPNCKFVSRSVWQNFVKNNKLCLRRRHENVVKITTLLPDYQTNSQNYQRPYPDL